MIMARNEDGTYSQVGFVKDNAGIDTEYIYDKDGDIVFEKGFTRETSGTVPLTINGIGKDLKDWSITGNTVQNGTPTLENPVEVQAVGDRTGNLFDKNATDVNNGYISGYYLRLDGSPIKPSSSLVWNTSEYIEITSGNIVLSALSTMSSGNPSICFYDSSKNYIIGYSYNNDTVRIHTVPNEAKYCRISIDERVINQLMLNYGSTALPYEPYGYKIPFITSAEDGSESITTPIYLPTPLYSGEVMRSDGSREVKFDKLVLTGEEAITTHKTFEDGTISIRISSSKAKANGIIYCTHLQNVTFAELYNSEKQGISTHLKNELNNLYCLISGFTNLTQYKDFFRNEYAAGTPVTVWYQLATPTTETFTAPQIPTLSGTTVIDVDTEVKPTEMYIKYKSSK